MTTAGEPKCSLCDKQGLLIMPVRYAVAPADMGLPAVTAPLKVEDVARSVGKGSKQDLTLHGSTSYTARLLRSGYLYVYDEKRDRMAGYWITQDGYYMSFPPETAVPEQAASVKTCDFAGHQELAGCIAIPDAGQAGIVWLGYSDVQWTPAVIKAHRGNTGKLLRELHMRAFDAGAWAKAHQTSQGAAAANSRGSTPHAVAIDALVATVAEYAAIAPSAPVGPSVFISPSAPNFHLRAGQADGTLTACSRRSPGVQGVIVALDDPAGVAQDLAALINWHQERLLDTRVAKNRYGAGYGNYPTTYRNLLALDGAIKSLRLANDEKVKLQVFQSANDLADYLKVSYGVARSDRAAMAMTRTRAQTLADRPVMGKVSAGPGTMEEIVRQEQLDAAIRNPSPQAVQAAQHESWGEYLARINGPCYSAWVDEYNTALATMQKQHIELLAQAHAAWMQSNLLSGKLDCTHDGQDVLSGDAYAETLQRCMAATQQIEGCAQVYRRWLAGDITDKTNLLLRALVLRQDELISAMATTPLDPVKVPWAKLMDQYTKHVQVLLRPPSDAQSKMRAAQVMMVQAKQTYDAALTDFASAAATAPGLAFADNPIKHKAEQAENAWKDSQAKTAEAQREMEAKLLPDSIANVLVQIGGPIATALREHNDNAAEKGLMRWMAIVGVTLRTPVGVIEVADSARETIEHLSKIFVENLAAAGEHSGKPLSAEQVRQLTRHAKRQVRGSFASGNIGAFETAMVNGVRAKMAVFITEDMHKELAQITDPTKKITWLAEHVKTPATLHQYGVLKVASRAKFYGAVAEGALTAIDAAFKGVGWKTMLDVEAKALKFQKTRGQDIRDGLGTALLVGAMATGVGNVVKAYGTWRSVYAMGLGAPRTGGELVEKAIMALRIGGVLIAAVSGMAAVMDFVDSNKSRLQQKWGLTGLQFLSGASGFAAASFAAWAAWVGDGALLFGLSLTGWGLILAVALVGLAMVVEKVKGDSVAQWLEHCYWGTMFVDDRYNSSVDERDDFNKLMTGT